MRPEPGAERSVEIEIRDCGEAERRIAVRGAVGAERAIGQNEMAELRRGMAIAVPMRRKERMPSAKSSCRTIVAMGAPMPKADAVTRRPA